MKSDRKGRERGAGRGWEMFVKKKEIKQRKIALLPTPEKGVE